MIHCWHGLVVVGGKFGELLGRKAKETTYDSCVLHMSIWQIVSETTCYYLIWLAIEVQVRERRGGGLTKSFLKLDLSGKGCKVVGRGVQIYILCI